MLHRSSSDFARRTTLTLFVVTLGVAACACGGESGTHGGSAGGATKSEGVFVPTGNLNVARYGQTATLLPSGKVLMAGGYDGEHALASAELYDPQTGTFTPTGSMTAERVGHSATALPNGQVLIVGGADSSNPAATEVLASAELYDPSSETFTATGSLATARYNQTATRLPSGKVLVAGGYAVTSILDGAELYDPDTGTFSATGSMTAARTSHAATSLSDGTVLLSGGWGAAATEQASAELYDPITGVFTPTGKMSAKRIWHTETLLANGTVLIAGMPSPAELYEPASGTFADIGNTLEPLSGHSATVLPDGKVLLAGGAVRRYQDGHMVAPAELFDPETGTFAATGDMTAMGAAPNATLLPNGKVLIAGGLVPDPAQDLDVPHSALAAAELFEE